MSNFRQVKTEDVDSIQKIMLSGSISMYNLCNVSKNDIEEKFSHYLSVENKKKLSDNISNFSDEDYMFIYSEGDTDIAVGYVELNNDKNFIHAIYLQEKYQGKGIGKKVFEKILEVCDRNKNTYLHVLSTNSKAIKLYENYGFYKTDRDLPKEELKTKNGIYLQDVEMVLPSS